MQGSAETTYRQSSSCATSADNPPGSTTHRPTVHRMQQSKSKSEHKKPDQTKPKPKNMADLLAMLEDAPAGPVEIDTALLYSPQSSVEPHSSPSGSIVTGQASGSASPGLSRSAGSKAAKTKRHYEADLSPRPEFSLKAYRPISIEQELPTAAVTSEQLVGGWNSPGSQLSEEWELQHQQSEPGLLSPADSETLIQAFHRPLSAPQQASHDAHSLPSPSFTQPSSTVSCQLRLDDITAAGVQGSTAQLLQAGREARLQRLAEPRRHLWEKCARMKLEEEQEELKECTFVPSVGRPPESNKHRPGMPVDERLYRWNEGKEQLMQRMKEEQDAAKLADCTFNPQLNRRDKHLKKEYTPIHRRIGEEQRKRSVKIAQLRVLEDLTNPHTTFTPKLNPRSRQLVAEREERELLSPTGSLRRSKSFAGDMHGESGCSFSPSINPASQRLLEDSCSVPSDFQERLRYFNLKRDAKQKQLQAEKDVLSCTFRPDTGNAVEVLAFSGKAGQLLETEEERYERMASEEAAKLEARRAAKEQEIYGGMNFKPQLNPRSLRMAKASTVEELASAEKATHKVAQLKAAEEERMRRECTFRPNTTKPRVKGFGVEYQPPEPRARLALAGQGFDGILDRIQDYQAEREANAARAKEEAERKQLQECSFVPDINRQPVKAKGPVLVKGLDRFLEQKQLAERQRREVEKRAAQVFLLNPRRPTNAATVPQPFQLSGTARLEQRALEKQSEAMQSALRSKMAECTFRPQTNYAKRQQALAGILQQQDDGLDFAVL